MSADDDEWEVSPASLPQFPTSTTIPDEDTLEEELTTSQFDSVKRVMSRQRQALLTEVSTFKEQVFRAIERTQLLQSDISNLSDIALKTTDVATLLAANQSSFEAQRAELLNSFQKEKQKLVQQIDSITQREIDVRKDLEQTRSRADQAEQQLSKVRKELYASQDSVRRLNLKLSNAHNDRDAEIEALRQLAQQTKNLLEKENQQLQEELVEYQCQAEEVKRLSDAYDQKSRECEEVKEAFRCEQMEWWETEKRLRAQIEDGALKQARKEEVNEYRELLQERDKMIECLREERRIDAERLKEDLMIDVVGDVERLTRVVELLGEKNHKLEQENEILNQSAADQASEMIRLQTILKERELSVKDAESLEVDLMKKNDEIRQYKDELNSRSMMIVELESETQTLRSSLLERDLSLESANEKCDRLKEEIDLLEVKVARVNALESELLSEKEAHVKTRAELVSTAVLKGDLEDHIEVLEMTLSEAKEDMQMLREEIDSLKITNRRFEASLERDFTEAIQSLANDCNRVTARGLYESFQLPLEGLSAEEQILRLKKTVVNVFTTSNNYKRRLEVAMDTVRTKEDEIESLKTQMEMRQSAVEREYSQYADALCRMESECVKLRQDEARLTSQLRCLTKELESLKQKKDPCLGHLETIQRLRKELLERQSAIKVMEKKLMKTALPIAAKIVTLETRQTNNGKHLLMILAAFLICAALTMSYLI